MDNSKNPDDILNNIKKGEKIYYSPSWWRSTLLWVSFTASSYFIYKYRLLEIAIFQANWSPLLWFSSPTIAFLIFGLYKQNKKAFSIRVNAFGMMVTNYSKQKWYPWSSVENIDLKRRKDFTAVVFEFGEQIGNSAYTSILGYGYTQLPKCYNVNSYEMAEILRQFKNEYSELNLDEFSQLEIEAMKNPQDRFSRANWGRSAAQQAAKA